MEPEFDVQVVSFRNVRDESININGEPIKCPKLEARLLSGTSAAMKTYCSQLKALTTRNSIIYTRFIS